MPRHGGSHPRRRKPKPYGKRVTGGHGPEIKKTGDRLAADDLDPLRCRCGKDGTPCPIHTT